MNSKLLNTIENLPSFNTDRVIQIVYNPTTNNQSIRAFQNIAFEKIIFTGMQQQNIRLNTADHKLSSANVYKLHFRSVKSQKFFQSRQKLTWNSRLVQDQK